MKHMSKTENKKTFAIVRETRMGRTWYQSKNVGEITRLMRNLWTTTDRDAAIMLAGQVGGTVVTV